MTATTLPHRWREPTRALRLRGGTYIDRYLLGLLLIVAGGLSVQGSNTYALQFLVAGTAAHAVGWSVLPSAGWRRFVVVLPATAQTWFLVSGPQSVGSLVVPYLAWLLVRHRPPASYLTVLFPLAMGFVVPPLISEYSGMPVALAASMAVFVGSAWLARVIHERVDRGRTMPIPSNPDYR